MVKYLLPAVAGCIREKMGRNVRIFYDAVPQGLQVPAFFIRIQKQVFQPGMGRRFEEDDWLEIVYVPPKGDILQELCMDTAGILEEILSWVHTEAGLIRGDEMKSRIEHGMLFFEVHYRSFWYRPAPEDDWMRRLTIYDAWGENN